MENKNINPEITISVIITSYNSVVKLNETIISILNGLVVPNEIIIVDDCSKYKPKIEHLKKQYNKIRLIKLKKNSGGPAKPRNVGIRNAKSGWVAFCDAGDIWHPEKLLYQKKLILETKAKLLCTQIQEFKQLRDIKFEINKYCCLKYISYKEIIKRNCIALSSVLISKEILNSGYSFKETSQYVAVEDYELWLSLFNINKFCAVKCESPLLFYKKEPKSISSNKIIMIKKVFLIYRNQCTFQKYPFFSKNIFCVLMTMRYIFLSIIYRLILRIS